MLEPISEYVNETFQQRAIDISNEISVNNADYKELSKRILSLEEKLKDLPGFNEYKEVLLLRESLAAWQLYWQGLKDGYKLRTNAFLDEKTS